MKILHLTLSKIPFDVMVTGEKTHEYRKPSKWILSRLIGKHYTHVKFTHGYGSDKPYFICEFLFWQSSICETKHEFSNGLSVNQSINDVIIALGSIIEKGNL
jgi:hypothetical protein